MPYRIGTGSWADREYKQLLPVPPERPASDRLAAYAARFQHVEVNASAYRIPTREQVEGWIMQTPPGFTFSVKLHQRFSQSPSRACADQALVQRSMESVHPLVEAERFTCFLLVLPPGFSPTRHTLEEISAIAERLAPRPLAVELRHRGWVEADQREATLAHFRAHDLIWVAVDMPRIDHSALLPPIDVATHPNFAYLRCHGRNRQWPSLKSAAEKHDYLYPKTEVSELVARARRLARGGRTVHLIANNHAEDYAVRTALALQELLQRGSRKPVQTARA